ncbi:BMC domain-containing protein [Alkalibaculum sp. M08DMB]|uniref:BMC domain-containing protein n=2 Tax=Alkalibaculum sporogenes TaxID=2655001 RepID=A0A6A7K7X5_9FIRM|nr:BMC domain-containing protein [Alkalibaculum sporogenes]MPW25514.1 BMC domain-containing protein [Alkalibaculum sporogenes]
MLRDRSFSKDFFDNQLFDALGLIQGKLSEMILAADIAEKSASVKVLEIKGICPQHFTMIALLGDTSSVNVALESITKLFDERRKANVDRESDR